MKTILISLAALSVCMLYSCNEQEKKTGNISAVDTTAAKSAPDTATHFPFVTDCSGVGNLLIDSGEAAAMKKDFEKYYAVKNPKLIGCSVWIDKLVLESLVTHFTKENCDGVRFYNAIDPKTKATTIIMVPTKSDTTAKDPKSSHADNWASIAIPSSTAYEYKQHSLGKNPTEDANKIFNRTYGGYKPGDSSILFSSSVWISECVFKALLVVLNERNSEFDGIRVWQAAYHDNPNDGTRPGQAALRQSTVILVPTLPYGKTGHQDDWTILKKETGKVSLYGGGGYNHGELCPKICP
jgi:hypothetical protein